MFMKPKKNFIHLNLYKKIIDNVPIVGVDIIVEYKNGILLIKRSEEPKKDVWWFPGGRVLKYETPGKAAVRITKKETGLSSRVKNFVGVYTTTFERWKGIKHFSIHLVHHVVANGNVLIDETSSDYKIVNKIQKNMHPYMKKALKDSRVFSKDTN